LRGGSIGGLGAPRLSRVVEARRERKVEAARAGDLSQLELALAFYRSVDAERFVREGEALLAASA
jgi:hypothetical protein